MPSRKKSDTGKIIRKRGNARYLTERKRAEEALRRSNENLSKIIKTAPDATCITRLADGTFLEINQAFTDITGYTPEELLGRSSLPGGVALWTKEEDRDRMVNELKTKGEVISMEMSLRMKDETIRTSLLSARILEFNGEKCILTIAHDINERKRMEEALHESEQHYKMVSELAADYVYKLGVAADGKVTMDFVSDNFYSLTGRTREDAMTVESWSSIIHPDDLGKLMGLLRQLIVKPQSTELECRTYIYGRKQRWVNVFARSERDEKENRVTTIVGAVKDITERKQAEGAIAAEKERLSVTLRSIGDAVISTDMRGNIMLMNKVAETLTAWRLSEAEGRPLTEVFHIINELTRKPCVNPVEKVLASGSITSLENHTLLVARDGKEFVITDSGAPIKDRENRTIGIVLVFRDNTEKQRAQEAMRNAQRQITEALSFNRMILESSPVGILVYKASGECVSVNRAAVGIIGGTTEQLLAQNFRSLGTWKRDGLLESADSALTSGKPVTRELSSISSFGKDVWFKTSFAPFTAAGESHLLFLIEDISERRKAEEESRALEDQLMQRQKLDSLGVLAGGIAHDFNNLLTGIFGNIELARSKSKDARTIEFLDATLAAMNRAKGLTHQLLTFSKGGSPVQKITPLVPFIQETAQFVLSGSNISCRFSLAENLWPCHIDKNQVGQVIDNIVINAQQAMPGGGTIEITAANCSFGEKEHPPLAKGDYVKVAIKDSGIGIPKEIMPRIFDPFYTTKTKGHGLGLATCYSIINRHGGCIDVESEPGKGSSFYIYLQASAEAVTVNAAPAAIRKGSGTIIVVDDEEMVRETFRQMLEALGYTVICKNDGKEALDFYGREKADCRFAAMIFDLTIPGGMGGMEAIAEIRKLDKVIPVFVASGYADNSVMKNPVEYGFTASISKPFTMAEVSETLNSYLKH